MFTELKAFRESTVDYEALEEKIKVLFKTLIYYPVLREFGHARKVLKNSRDDLLWAIQSGQVTFNRGTFSGRFDAATSKELRSLGARFDRTTRTYKIKSTLLPLEVRNAISASEVRFQEKLELIDKKLAQILPADIAGSLKVEKLFDRTIWKAEREFQASVKGIAIAPVLSDEARKRVAQEWETNMQLWIQDFTEKEIKTLRADIKTAAFAGDRYGSAIKTIQESYGVSANKAKFLARQETSLLMTKLKQTRYEAAGVTHYKWGCVAGSKNHPVRPWHKSLEGKVFTWDNPPITTKAGTPVRRNNPGQDYNCRCFARPLVGYKKET